MNVSPTMSWGLIASIRREAVIAGQHDDERFRSDDLEHQIGWPCFSSEERHVEPLTRASARSGEYWLETVISILGSSSRRIRIASGNQSISFPVRKPSENDDWAG